MTTDFLIFRPEFRDPQKGQDTSGAKPVGPSTTSNSGGGAGSTVVEPGPGPDTSGQGGMDAAGCTNQLLLILPMIAIFYFLLIRPQQKQEKVRREMVATLKKGDKVVMNSGLHGEVAQLSDSTVSVLVDRDVRLTFDRSAIQRSVSGEEAQAEPNKSA